VVLWQVAGTLAGVTAVQLDVKLAGGVPRDTLYDAVKLASSGRRQILCKSSQPQAHGLQPRHPLYHISMINILSTIILALAAS
jgi:polyribonucleotide nucleotidyltransferase